VDPHEPPIPAKVKTLQVRHLVEALRDGTPNRNRIALQMVKDMLDEASYSASPGHVLPDGGPAGAMSRLVGKLRDRADADQGD
ncbi:MAG TPA: hypothetical protein VG435_15805, partial [Acidimicrobiales bacterium]|nr:hypothetical protein [Acidimicrobiales bacterium]